MTNAGLDQLAINTIRTLSIDAVQAANSGHPGTPMALAPLVYTLWNRVMRFDPQDPIWPGRDRFVLSNGHASMLLWSVLYLTGTQAVNAEYETLGRPAVTLDDIRRFRQLGSHAPGALAARAGRTLFATWHSRFAPAVEPARQWLTPRRIRSVHINWKEDVRVWHPGQSWIFEPGGLGVFDPGINALSILTRILPQPLFVTAAELCFPANREAPIAACVSLADAADLPITAEFDFRQSGPQSWDIVVETDDGLLTLSGGGARLVAGGRVLADAAEAEYRGLYRRFVELTATGTSDVDLAPLRLVADAFLLGRRRIVEPFQD